MALFGGKKSTSTTTTVNDVDTTNQNIQGIEGISIVGSDSTRVTLSDQGAITAAQDISEQAIISNERASRDSLNFAEDIAADAFLFGGRSLEFGRDSLNLGERSLELSNQNFDTAADITLTALKSFADFSTRGLVEAFDSANKSTALATDFVEGVTQPEKQLIENVSRSLLIGGAIVLAAFMFRSA